MRRLQQDKVGLNILSQYDPVVVRRAAAVLKQMLSENGHSHARVRVRARDIPPDFIAVTFVVAEGPKVNTRNNAVKNQSAQGSSGQAPAQHSAANATRQSTLLPAIGQGDGVLARIGVQLRPLSPQGSTLFSILRGISSEARSS